MSAFLNTSFMHLRHVNQAVCGAVVKGSLSL